MGLFSDHRGGCGDTSCCFTAEAAIMGLFAGLLEAVVAALSFSALLEEAVVVV